MTENEIPNGESALLPGYAKRERKDLKKLGRRTID